MASLNLNLPVVADTDEHAPATRRATRAARRRRFSVTNVAIAGVLLAGAATVLYPTAAAWFSDRIHATEVSGYVTDVASAGDSELQSALEDAHDYNDLLPDGPLRDPFTLSSDGSAESVEAGREEYNAQLKLGASDTMARIRVPDIGVDLPIYHGTDDESLQRGVGHLYGSALPVGGDGTHAVLSGHSGLPSATLFSHLNQLRKGDLFYIDVAGETLTYEVDQILTVDPRDGDALRRSAGHDYATLLTCTPTGINTHRLLVRGERIDTASGEDTQQAAAPNASDPGFPWWTLIFGSAAALSTIVAYPRKRPS